MKRRFLPFSLLLVIMILGQYVMADQGGHYVPRVKGTSSVEAYIGSMRANQQTGLIDPAWMLKAAKQTVRNGKDDNSLYWISMGPDNMGGRTTSIVYNNANMNEVFVGSMGGGVFYTWNLGVSWHQVGENLMVSCMAQAADGTIYVGTGDGGEAASHNTLGNMSYSNSFIGSGMYAIKKVGNKYEMTAVPSTTPTEYNGVTEWSFINDIAVVDNTVIVATESGLRYSNITDGIVNWNYAKVVDADGNPTDLTGSALEVKVTADKKIVAAVDKKIYIGNLSSMECRSSDSEVINEDGEIEMIAAAAGLLDIATAPSDANVIYASCVAAAGNHAKMYRSDNQGQTWHVILPSVTNTNGHQVYGGRGLYNHGLAVDPANADRLYVLGYDLWSLEKAASDPEGYFLSIKQSDGTNNSIYAETYLHVGINAMAFDPRNTSKAYVATDGGIFQANAVTGTDYLAFTNCNRGYVTTRALGVAYSGTAARVVAGLLDHGPVLIEANEDYNNLHMSHGAPLYPSNDASVAGAFDESYHGGRVAISSIKPDAMFISTVDGAMKRTETDGVDYDISNFSTSFSYSGFNMPFGLWESFNDPNSVATVWLYAKQDYEAGDLVQCYSTNGDYPFTTRLDHALPDGDSIEVQDPVMSKLFVASNNTLSMTLQPIQFNTSPTFYTISKKAQGFDGNPQCMAISEDGDVLFAGMRNGKFARVTNLRAAVDASTAYPDSANFAPVTTAITLPISGQCVTSVAIDAQDHNKVVVTLGNYGNDQYVLYSDNALADEPTFTVKQGNLPKMPVYSSVYEMSTGKVIIGTERGIYMTDDIAAANVNWVAANENMGVVPVLDLRQQTMYQPDQTIITPLISEEGVTYDTTFYVGVHNQGAIYAATYGRGVFRCENFLQHIGTEVQENTVATTSLNMYPNPVRDEAKVSFELKSNSTVSYQVYDMTGRMVKVVNLGTLTAGNHEVNVSVDGLSNGAYLLRLNAGASTSTVKFMVY